MASITQSIVFNQSGLDSDSSHSYMQLGDSPYFLNSIISEDGKQGIRLNIKGNRKIAYAEPLVLSNTYAVKGSYYNHLLRKVFFFIFSQPYDSGAGVYLYDNRLLAYEEDTEQIVTIFKDPRNYFGIDPSYLLTDIKMLGNWMYFNPRTSEPRMIDVEMAYNYTNYPAFDDQDVSFSAIAGDVYTYKGGLFRANSTVTAGEDPVNSNTKWDRIGNSYQSESTVTGDEFEQAFLAIKTPPVEKIDASYGSDPSRNFNSVSGKVFRFCHRYQYVDNSFSVCSAHSNLTLPINGEIYNGEVQGGTLLNNYIILSFSLYSAALIKNIEIFFQEIDGDWKRATVINRQDQTLLDTLNYSYNFYNNESYPTIDQTIPYIIYDAVPRIAGAQEIINKNVLTYARCTEGFPNIDKDLVDVTFTPRVDELTEAPPVLNTLRRNLIPGDISKSWVTINKLFYTRWVSRLEIKIGTWFPGSGVVQDDYFEFKIGSYAGSFILTSAMVVSATSLANGIVAELKKTNLVSAHNIYVAGTGATTVVRIERDYFEVSDFTIAKFYSTTAISSLYSKYHGFKTGAYHPFCLFYFDSALRRGDAQVVTDMAVYIPSFNESTGIVSGTGFKWAIDWEVNHTPPSWAQYWSWGYAGNSRCSRFVQYIVGSVTDTAVPDPSAPADVANTVKIDLTPLQTIRTTTTDKWNCFPNSSIPLYSFTEGDRIRFITKATNPTITGTRLGDLLTTTYDFEIIKFDATSHKAYIKSKVANLTNVGVNSLAEIYTPKGSVDALDPTKTLTYYEYGDRMMIVQDDNGNLVHKGQSQTQVLGSLPAKGTFVNGDVYHIMRTPSKPLCTFTGAEYISGAFHESMGWSDFYNSDDWDRGKLGLESPVGEKTLNVIRYSDVYLQNTSVNGLSTFGVNSFKEINDTYGKIIAIIEMGNQLKVVQENKVASVGIGRTEYADAEGNITVVGSDQILGVIRYSETNYGSIFPESLSKNNRYLYGFDPYNGVVWRDSPNGLFPISGQYEGTKNGKMVSYFKEKSKRILTSGVQHCNVFTVWDEEYKMLYVVFKDIVDKTNNETVVFHEPSDRWITFTEMDYTPAEGFNEMLELTYSVVKGFDLGLGYSFDENTRFTVFNIGAGAGTSANVRVTASPLRVSPSLPAPTLAIDVNYTATERKFNMSLPTSFLEISYMSLSVTDMTWVAEEFGEPDMKETVMTIVGGNPDTYTQYAEITYIPSWITVISWDDITGSGSQLGVGSWVLNGNKLHIYPSWANTEGTMMDSVEFIDNYANSARVYVTHSLSLVNAGVSIATQGEETNLDLYDTSGRVAVGSKFLYITFTPYTATQEYGAPFSLLYVIYKQGIVVGNGSIFVYNSLPTTSALLTMSSAAVAGDSVLVTLAIAN